MERTQKVEIRVTPEEKERLMQLARERGVSTSEYVRTAALGQLTITRQTVQSDERVPPKDPEPPDPPEANSLYDQIMAPQTPIRRD